MRFLIIIILVLLLIPYSYSWNSKTHEYIVERVYNSLEIRSSLNLELMKFGSTSPDLVFHDNRLHHYPPSYDKAVYWLNLTKFYISQDNLDNASYSFGVASHYISDSYSIPHHISKEDPKLHTKFENQVKFDNIKAKCTNSILDINQTLYEESSLDKEKEWQDWINTKNPEIPTEKVSKSIILMYSIALEAFDTSCVNPTIIEKSNFTVDEKTIIYALITIIMFFALFLLLNKRPKN